MSLVTDMNLLIDLLIKPDMTKEKFQSLLFKIHNRSYLVIGSEKNAVIYKYASLSKCNDLECFSNIRYHPAINKRGHFCKKETKPYLTEKININNESKLMDLYIFTKYGYGDYKLIITNGNHCHNFEIKYTVFDCEKSDMRWLNNYHHILAIKNMIELPDDVIKYIMSYICCLDAIQYKI